MPSGPATILAFLTMAGPHFWQHQSGTIQVCRKALCWGITPCLNCNHPLSSSFPTAWETGFGLPNHFLHPLCQAHGGCPFSVC